MITLSLRWQGSKTDFQSMSKKKKGGVVLRYCVLVAAGMLQRLKLAALLLRKLVLDDLFTV